jgi:pyruvate kinase
MHALADVPDATLAATTSRPRMTKLPLTRIVATPGPASDSLEMMTRLAEAGARVLRLNFSHGGLDDHKRRLDTAREVERRIGRPIAVLGDLQGPKIRVGKVAGDGVMVETGRLVEFHRGTFEASAAPDEQRAVFSATYDRLVDDVEPGQRLLVNDGAVRMLIVETYDDRIVCTVTHGGRITSSKGINLPDSNLSVDTITARDIEHARWAVENKLDLLALSFVRRGSDVESLRSIVRQAAPRERPIPIISKIEVPQAIERIDEILEASDAMMVARGDLGVEMDIAEVPVLQKNLIERARHHGKPCIVATQMLESMIDAPSPTRAEASDVAAAIFEQVDATMLSGETAVGKWPILAVEQMRRITANVEDWQAARPARSMAPQRLRENRHPTAALAHGVWTVAHDVGAACVIVWSETGSGAMYLSRHDFGVPIVAVTTDQGAARRMELLRGVLPVRMDQPASFAEFLVSIDRLLLDRRLARRGEPCIVVAGEPLGAPRVTNRLAIHTVAQADAGPVGSGGNPTFR